MNINREAQTPMSVDLSIPKLRVASVSKTFNARGLKIGALNDVSFDVNNGDFICLLGPSGCGKTTLLRMVAGLEKPEAGELLIEGKPIRRPGPDRLVMFQNAALFPWLNAIENVEFGLRLQKKLSRKEIREKANDYLELVGLKEFGDRYIHELSGGMKQRVELARALAMDPQMLLMDEPFAALDALTREQLYFDLQRIWAATKKTILLVTHNVRESVCLGNRILVFSSRPGKLCADVPIDLPHPRDINNPQITALAAEVMEKLRIHMQEAAV